ncbi:hypothetical protein DSCA_46850 [Desulfosarcina alkanivorans]|uniref:Uncharacterized protein n=1 Tax=Desulfosarcina alkanivorans TaxID=571177 RepID=A0A5K7YR08_9BACT|nr:hypothetical protein DSCA_46850 [Desulfosarcina alkanivorans]
MVVVPADAIRQIMMDPLVRCQGYPWQIYSFFDSLEIFQTQVKIWLKYNEAGVRDG